MLLDVEAVAVGLTHLKELQVQLVASLQVKSLPSVVVASRNDPKAVKPDLSLVPTLEDHLVAKAVVDLLNQALASEANLVLLVADQESGLVQVVAPVSSFVAVVVVADVVVLEVVAVVVAVQVNLVLLEEKAVPAAHLLVEVANAVLLLVEDLASVPNAIQLLVEDLASVVRKKVLVVARLRKPVVFAA